MTTSIVFDPTDPGFIADPYPYYRQLRETAPVCHIEEMGGWLFTRYADNAAIMRSGSVVKPPIVESILQRVPDEVRPDVRTLERVLSGSLPFTNPPQHTRLRSVITPAFSPRAIERTRPRIQEMTDLLLDQAAGRGKGDLLTEVGYRLPAGIVLEILGIPDEGHDRITQWVVDIIAVLGRTQYLPDPAGTALRANQACVELSAYVQELIDARRKHPVDDVLTQLVSLSDDEGRLTDEELVIMCLVIITGGLETTANSIVNSVWALLRDPERLEELRENPALTSAAVDELLRYDPTAQVMPPWLVVEEMEVGGRTFGPGDLLYTVIGAANRDPEVFPDPDVLDFHRVGGRHLGFGIGSHYCPASLLGRIEVESVCAAIAQRFPGLRVDPDAEAPAYRPDPVVRGLASLHVVF